MKCLKNSEKKIFQSSFFGFKTLPMPYPTLLMILSYSMDNAQPHKNVIYHQHNNSAKNPLKSVGSFTIVKKSIV